MCLLCVVNNVFGIAMFWHIVPYSPLSTFLSQMVSSMYMYITRRDVIHDIFMHELKLKVLPKIFMDENSMHEIVYNLISNENFWGDKNHTR